MKFINMMMDWLIFGGAGKLSPYENVLIGCAMERLPEQDRIAIVDQLAKIRTVQRFNDYRMVAIHLQKIEGISLISDKSDEYCIAKITHMLGDMPRKGSIVFHDGKISSIEFDSKIKSNMLSKSCKIIAVTMFPREKPAHQEAQVIDREEHGDGE